LNEFPLRRAVGKAHGFTLIELVVVMALLAVMTSFAVPALRTAFFPDQLKGTARRLLGLVNEVGQASRAEQQEYVISYDRSLRIFRVRLGGTAGGAATERSKEAAQRFRALPLPEEVQLVDSLSVHGGTEPGGLILRFSQKGYVDKTLIHLRDAAGQELTLTLSPFLGVSRVFASYRTLEDERHSWANH